MTIITRHTLKCDFCSTEFPDPRSSITAVEFWAAQEGWIKKTQKDNPDVHLCPEHSHILDAADAMRKTTDNPQTESEDNHG